MVCSRLACKMVVYFQHTYHCLAKKTLCSSLALIYTVLTKNARQLQFFVFLAG